jgi:electron transfer flavoprotein beta subunit
MNIAVFVKASVDPNRVRVDPSGNLDTNAMPLVISEYDKNAVEEALRIRERAGGKIAVLSALTWGPLEKRVKEHEAVVREALAMGADEAYVIVDERLIPGDAALTSFALSKLVERLGKFDLYVFGEASTDMLSSQVPPRLSQLLDVPILSFVRKLELDNGKVRAIRGLEDITQSVEASLPAMVSVSGEINKPRYPTMLQLRSAFRKPLSRISLGDLAADIPPRMLTRNGISLLSVARRRVKVEGESTDQSARNVVQVLVEEGVIKQ